MTKNSFGRMASMPPRLLRPQLLLLLFVLFVTGPASCNIDCDPSEVNDMMSSGQVDKMATAARGFKAALIHKSHYSLRRSTTEADKSQSSVSSLLGDAKKSQKRWEGLGSRIPNERRLAENAPSNSPAGQPANWESPLPLDLSDIEYLMEISLGTPPQSFVAIADTGSDLAWVQCSPLQTHINTDPPFNPSKSSTYAKLSCASSACEFLKKEGGICDNEGNCIPQCEYSSSAIEGSDCGYYYQYGDLTITNGTLAEDTIHIDRVAGGVQSVSKFWFGCSHNATPEGWGVADGLVGLGRGEISFPSQLGRYFGSVFSYCLVNRSLHETETSRLTFGDAALSATAANGSRLQLQYTPILNSTFPTQTYYYVGLESITVDGVAVRIPGETFAIQETGGGGFVFDSGSPYTLLLGAAYDPLVESISKAITQYERTDATLLDPESALCYNATWETWASEYGNTVPTLSFKFGEDANFDLGVGNLWTNYNFTDGAPYVCMTISRVDKGLNIFGNWQQRDHHIVYDLENQQIGFATTFCES